MKDHLANTNSDAAAEQTEDRRVPDDVYTPYIDERKNLSAAELDLGKSFDKWILTLAGGALGLSLTFAKELGLGLDGAGGACLAFAWVWFACAVYLALLSIYYSPKACEDFRNIMDEEMEVERSGPEPTQDYWARVRARQLRCKRWRHIPRLNQGSLWAFMFGVLFLGVSVVSHVNQGARSVTSDPAKSANKGVKRVVSNSWRPEDGKTVLPCSDKPVQDDRGVKPSLAPVGQGPKPEPKPTPPQDGK